MDSFRGTKSFEIIYRPDCSREELLSLVAKCQVLVSRSETDVDKAVIDAAAQLKVIARAAVGVGNIDIPYATEKGILVINTPGKNTNSAAEMTMALLLSMMRHVPEAHHKVKEGGWDRHSYTGRELKGKTIGLIGVGNVGHRVAKFCKSFDMEVLAYDPYISTSVFQRLGITPLASLEELASRCQILSVHVPLNKETKGMVHQGILSLMAKGSWVVNAARGGIILEKDILNALESGQLEGAALDTWETEPKPAMALASHPKVYAAPHIGASTEEAQLAIGETIYEQVVKALEGGVVDYPVNLPQVGIIESPLLRPYAILAEKLGAMAAQILDFNPTRVVMAYRGDLAGLDHSLVRLSFMKGYASRVVDGFVSFVNAGQHFEKLGLVIEEDVDPEFDSYRSALKIKISGSGSKDLALGGIVFDSKYPRISLINDFYFEIEPQGTFLVLENNDKPGVIGALGTFLASKGINIDSFDLARNRKGGQAMAMIRVDTPPQDLDMNLMVKLPNVRGVKLLQL
jgi:D-3-phosphoglycerate dehydrogenase